MDSPLLKYSAKDYFFKAALCHFCIDMLNAKVSRPRPCPTHLVTAPGTLGPLSGGQVPPQALGRDEPLPHVWPLTVGLGQETLALAAALLSPMSPAPPHGIRVSDSWLIAGQALSLVRAQHESSPHL